MKNLLIIFFIGMGSLEAQQIGPIKVSENQRFFENPDGSPFFWMADTAWELFHRTTKEEAIYYMETRASQGFNVVQAVGLAEIDGLNTPNSYGDKPLITYDPFLPNEKYWEYVDFIVKLAESNSIHIALLPTWGDKVYKDSWGVGPEILTPDIAHSYGKWIGERYAKSPNLIWVIGGDRNPRENSEDITVWNKLAEGILAGSDPNFPHLMSFHPQPNKPSGSSTWFHSEDWLDFNMHQTGHCPNQATYSYIQHDYNLLPTKPTLDGEPVYEEHPYCFNAKELGYTYAEDIRRIMYWNVFAGAAGQSYGCHAVWQMYTLDREPINAPLKPWQKSLDLPMANQVSHLKTLILSKPYFSRIPDLSLVVSEQKDDETFVIATRDKEGTYAMIYFPTGKSVNIDLSLLDIDQPKGKWFDPRTGVYFPFSDSKFTKGVNTVNPPSSGNDWVLVID